MQKINLWNLVSADRPLRCSGYKDPTSAHSHLWTQRFAIDQARLLTSRPRVATTEYRAVPSGLNLGEIDSVEGFEQQKPGRY